MRLFIAEKPSLARAIADILPRPHSKGDGFIRASNGDCVSWCVGHLLEQAEPKAYDPAYEKWQLQHLPIIPNQWQLKPKAKTKKQLAVLKKLSKDFEHIVHAGDPDREGQLLVDQVLDYVKLPARKKAAVQRCLISDLNSSAVEKAVASMRLNSEFIPLSTSALARQRADWLYGINLTRAYTLKGRSVGFDGLLSVGRVQTPLLGMVVRRDESIESFQSKPFYEVLAHISLAIPNSATKEAHTDFTALWIPSESCQAYMDEENRVLSQPLAENVAKRITEKTAVVDSAQQKKKSNPPPLPYSLSSLQIDAAKRYGLNAQTVLDTCQSLYERHKLITYPRSDCRYLPTEHLAEAQTIINAVDRNGAIDKTWLAHMNHARKSRAWNDAKVDAHHAIIPTSKTMPVSKLSEHERKVYGLITRQYCAQFCEAHNYLETVIDLIVTGGKFRSRKTMDVNLGWKNLYQNQPEHNKQNAQTDKLIPTTIQALAKLSKGQQLWCVKGEVCSKETQAPKHFSDATLLSAMTGISRFVSNPSIRKVLRETDGLGTEATRAGIIELLFKRDYLQRIGKKIQATSAGRALINCLPEQATTPDMTAHWEASLQKISEREAKYEQFMQSLTQQLTQLIDNSKENQLLSFNQVASSKQKPAYKRSRSTSRSKPPSNIGATFKKSGTGKKRSATSTAPKNSSQPKKSKP